MGVRGIKSIQVYKVEKDYQNNSGIYESLDKQDIYTDILLKAQIAMLL